jgi:3-hydroxyacyl-CoA dehydrogenase/enoyl-CoA hydratase/3-hydroxybutyryl-CoA epimerase
MSAFSYDITGDNIAVLTFDLPGEKVNKLTSLVMEELSGVLDELARKPDIKALVFRSGKEGNFIVGADIAEIRGIASQADAERLALNGQAILAKLESMPFPTVAAIHGPCMGGGLELALACTLRVASNDQRTALALPEVKLGILPAFGGTQRLPRLVGMVNALEMILSGKSVYSRKAKTIGLADEVTYPEILLDRALAAAKKSAVDPKYASTSTRASFSSRLIEGTPLSRRIIYREAEKRVLAETRGNYPAPLAALDAVRTGREHGRDAGFRREAELLGTLAPGEVSKNLISVYYLNELLKKSAPDSQTAVSRAAVLGAGVMGGGIAQVLGEKGVFVRMKDINTDAVGSGLREAWDIFRKRRKKGILTPIQARDGFDRITGTIDYTGLRRAQVAIEAVVESMAVKQSVLREFEANATDQAIFASNTSSLSITELASASGRPQNVAGMHFFNPVEKMPLVEIVCGPQTAPETLAVLSALSRRIGKLPVVVNDGPGFLVNRILLPYLGEAARLLEEGGRIDEIDGALLRFGMPMGAFILLDEIGIDIAQKVSEIMHRSLGSRAEPPVLLASLYKEGYFGKKNGKGFYRYQSGRRGSPDESVYRIARTAGRTISPEEIVDRTVLLMIKEGALCLEESIIDRPDLLDAALIFGIGFPPFRGGLLRYADRLGADAVVRTLEGYAKRYGARFEPPQSLVRMAGTGKGFYS